jgi:hypothetical protein
MLLPEPEPSIVVLQDKRKGRIEELEMYMSPKESRDVN